MNHSTPGLPVHHQLPEFTQTHVHRVSDAISSSVVPFSSCPQSLPASESVPMSQLLTWGGQSTGVSVLASFLPKKSQGWSPSEWAGWIPSELSLKLAISWESRGVTYLHSWQFERDQDMLPPNIPLWHKDYFELKATENQHIQGVLCSD